MKIAVLSDLHSFSGGPDISPVSFLDMTVDETDISRHPFVNLRELLRREGITADALVCCGDIGHKAKPECISWSWRWIHALASQLGDARVIATAGNHDLDSRFKYSDYDAKGVLQELVPSYPLSDHRLDDRYWARNHAVTLLGDCRILTLNSAAYHGYRDEFEHGRVSERTLSSMRSSLEADQSAKANVLVCHHHPFRHDVVALADYSEMAGGDGLIGLLSSGNYGRWLVIHGHRHWPNLTYAPGPGTSPVVFAAGSFAGFLYPELGSVARNQFYIIDLPTDDYEAIGLGLVGEFTAWDWIANSGWTPSQVGSGLPHKGGFGSREGGDLASLRVKQVLDSRGGSFASWSDVCAAQPTLKYLLPADIALCKRVLEDEHGIEVLMDDGFPTQVGRPT